MLGLMARSCMRVGEVLKLTPKDIENRKIIGIFHIPTKVVYTFSGKPLKNGTWLQKV